MKVELNEDDLKRIDANVKLFNDGMNKHWEEKTQAIFDLINYKPVGMELERMKNEMAKFDKANPKPKFIFL